MSLKGTRLPKCHKGGIETGLKVAEERKGKATLMKRHSTRSLRFITE